MLSNESKERWKEIAAELELDFIEDFRAFMESPALPPFIDMANLTGASDLATLSRKQLDEMGRILANPFLGGLLSSLFPGAATGVYREYSVLVFPASRTTGTTDQTVNYSVFMLLFGANLRLGLHIFREDTFQRIKKFLLHTQDISTGNETLDRLAVIRGERDEAVRARLTDHVIQSRLVHLFQTCRGVVVNDMGIRCQESGDIVVPERVREILDAAVEMAERLR